VVFVATLQRQAFPRLTPRASLRALSVAATSISAAMALLVFFLRNELLVVECVSIVVSALSAIVLFVSLLQSDSTFDCGVLAAISSLS